LINAQGLSVTATNDNGKLKLVSTVNGGTGNFTATGSALTQASAKTGVDAELTIDGVAHTSPTNVVTNALPGAELTLKGLTPTEPVALSVTPLGVEPEKIKAKLKAFVDAYNASMDAMRSRTTEKKVPGATTAADARKGVLFGDSGLRQVMTSLRSSVSATVTGTGNSVSMDELAELGISTGKATGGATSADALAGKLVIDDEKLTKALEDPASIERLLSGAAGFATRKEGVIAPLVDVGGAFDGRLTSSTSELSRLSKSLETMDDRLERKEEAYRKQFTALETALARSQSQQAQLQGQLAGLPRFS
jgi:flagellar hook-associated protein 2